MEAKHKQPTKKIPIQNEKKTFLTLARNKINQKAERISESIWLININLKSKII